MDISSLLTNPILSTPVPAYFVLGPLVVLLIMLITMAVKNTPQVESKGAPVPAPVLVQQQMPPMQQGSSPSGPASSIIQAMQQSQAVQATPVQVQQPVIAQQASPIQQSVPAQQTIQQQAQQEPSQQLNQPTSNPSAQEDHITGYVAVEKTSPVAAPVPQASIPPINSWKPSSSSSSCW